MAHPSYAPRGVDEPVRDLGISLMLPGDGGLGAPRLVALARAAEQHDRFTGVATPEFAGSEAFSLLAAVAVSTERLRLETAVVSAFSRSPVMIAMAARTLAELSENRFSLGLGGGSAAGAALHEMAFVRAAERVRRVLVSARGAMDEGSQSGESPLQGATVPRFPVLVAAAGSRMLELAAGGADGLIVGPVTPLEVIAEMAGAIRSRISRSFEIVAVRFASADVTGGAALRKEVAMQLAMRSSSRFAEVLLGAGGSERIREALRSEGIVGAASIIPEDVIASLMVGGPGTAYARSLSNLKAAGVNRVILVPVAARSEETYDHALSVIEMVHNNVELNPPLTEGVGPRL